ncbi:hypothetical protein LINPERHAP2_LOCUS7645 [Linum perenne]
MVTPSFTLQSRWSAAVVSFNSGFAGIDSVNSRKRKAVEEDFSDGSVTETRSKNVVTGGSNLTRRRPWIHRGRKRGLCGYFQLRVRLAVSLGASLGES